MKYYHLSEVKLPLELTPRVIESAAICGEQTVVAFCVASTPELALLGKFGGRFVKDIALFIYEVTSLRDEIPYTPTKEECYDASVWQEKRFKFPVKLSFIGTSTSRELYFSAMSMYDINSLLSIAEMLQYD